MKHFAEAVGRSTPGRLDKATKMVTVKSARNKIRKFISLWRRETHLIAISKIPFLLVSLLLDCVNICLIGHVVATREQAPRL
jgi:hypothetical protein